MPPPKPKPPGHPPHRKHVPTSLISSFLDRSRIDGLLAPWVADKADRAFLVRCLVDEGPAHHRGANHVLLCLLDEVRRRVGATSGAAARPVAVPMRLPPHLEEESDAPSYPLALDEAALHRLAPAGSRELDAMIDCLTDGPPQHVVANVVMVDLLGAILAALDEAEA